MIYDGQVILVIEGLHNFVEFETKQESEIKFWLPKYFPKRVRVIVTADNRSKSFNYLKKKLSTIVTVDKNSIVADDALDDLKTKKSFMSADYLQNFLELLKEKSDEGYLDRTCVKALSASFCPHQTPQIVPTEKVDLHVIRKILSSVDFEQMFGSLLEYEDIIGMVLTYFEDKIVPREQYRCLMIYLSLTFKGLTLSEVFSLTGIAQQDWLHILVFFKPYFFTFKGLWSISNESLKQLVQKHYLGADKQSALQYHIKIADRMNHTPNSIRKLEEQSIHYFLSKQHFLLKQTVTDVENFLIFFNPYTKYDLCRYWQYLEKEGYDPVCEYTKRLESFDLHYQPSAEDLFTIILQVSRFFKEFADFETKHTPAYRHPSIQGKIQVERVLQAKDRQKDRPPTAEEASKFGEVSIFNYLKKESALNGRTPEEVADAAQVHDTTPSVFTQEEEEEVDEEEAEDGGHETEVGGVAGVQVIDFLRDIGLDREIRCMEMVDPKAAGKVRPVHAGRGQPRESAAVSTRGAQRGHPQHEGALCSPRMPSSATSKS